MRRLSFLVDSGTRPVLHSSNGDASSNGRASAVATDESSEATRSNAIVENARHEFTSAFGDLARGKRNWQLIAFALGAAVVLLSLTTFRLASSAHPVPYVVEVDRLGSVSAVAAAGQMHEPDARLIASQLADFVRSVRTVLPTVAGTAQADLLRRGYAFTAPAAASFLNTYFSDASHDPRVLGARLARDVRVTSALKVPEPTNNRRSGATPHAQTWRLQWIETDRAVGPLDAGDSASVAAWEGYVTLDLVPPRTVDSIQDNPLGLHITSIAWTRLAGQAVPRDSINTLTGSSHDGGVR